MVAQPHEIVTLKLPQKGQLQEIAPRKGINPMIIDAILTCPSCDFKMAETMLENTCQYSYRCPHCKEAIKTKEGECCVFCCYADYPCPQAQISGASCCSPD